MFPIKDSNPSRSAPVVTWLIILLNALVFIVEISIGNKQEVGRFFFQFGTVPASFAAHPTDPHQISTLFTSLFLHAGWLHIIANMWALFIFGDNVEDRLGHFNYLLFYLFSGVVAGLTQVIFGPHVAQPTIGASGAIAGVLGAYLMLFPNASVLTLIPVGFIPIFLHIPAYFFLCFWFFTQAVAGTFSVHALAHAGENVAWFAHVGGFVTGFITVKIWARSDYPKWHTDEYRPF